MSSLNLGLIVEPDELEPLLDSDNLLVICTCKPDVYRQYHIPGAIHVEYQDYVVMQRPIMGLLPDEAAATTLFSAMGISDNTHVVIYDDEGGGKAARLIWTLQVYGHDKVSLLNGGLFSWGNEKHPMQSEHVTPTPATFTPRYDDQHVANREMIELKLGDADTAFIDARSILEYNGTKRFAERGGHIPGAIHWEWNEAMDQNNNARMRPAAELLATLAEKGVTPEQEIIAYCQSHHRSAYSCLVFQALGFTKVRGYPGSWSDWGNQPDTPVE